MLVQQMYPCLRLAGLAVLTGISLAPTQPCAQTLTKLVPPVVVAPASTPVCALLQKQLRFHEPFFGLGTWSEVAAEALAHASPACRQAIARGQAPEVAAALRDLAQRDNPGETQLRRFSTRLFCKLRVPEARAQILAGVHEPAVYADCADALFAMEWSEPEALQLRQRYLAGLSKEPLKTHLPPSLLQPPYVERLAPVLRAYDQAQRPGRDVLYRAMCIQSVPTAAETRALCSGLTERESEWAAQKLLGGQADLGLDLIAALPPASLPYFTAALRKFNAERRSGRDRLYGLLCERHPPQTAELRAACADLLPRQEARWAAIHHAQDITQERETYNRFGRGFASLFLGLSLFMVVQGLLSARQRRLQSAGR